MAPSNHGMPASAASEEDSDLSVGINWLLEAERTYESLQSASPLGTVLLSVTVPRLLPDMAEAEQGWGVIMGAALLGYASRATDPDGAVPSWLTATIESAVPFTDGGDVDYAALSQETQRLGALAEHVVASASDPDCVVALTGGKGEAWEWLSVAASVELRGRLLRRGLPKSRLPDLEGFSLLLRLGYVVRFVDEVVGEWPATEARHTDSASRDLRVPVP